MDTLVHSTSPEILLVVTHLPDAGSAHKLARHLVEARVAACVNVLAPCQSIYRWQGSVEEAGEVPLLAKTTAARYAALEAAIRSAHPYDVPEIIALPVASGLPEYLDWVAAEVAEVVAASC